MKGNGFAAMSNIIRRDFSAPQQLAEKNGFKRNCKGFKTKGYSEDIFARKLLFKGRLYAIKVTGVARWCLIGLTFRQISITAILSLFHFHFFCTAACAPSDSFCQKELHILEKPKN